MSTPISPKAGFTLTELLVSLAIFGLVSLAATSVLSLGKQIWSKAKTVPEHALFDAEIAALRKVVAGKVTSPTAKGGGFSGTQNGLAFQGLARLDDGSYEISSITVEFSHAETIIAANGQNSAKTTRLRHIRVGDVAFYGRKTGANSDDWAKGWVATDPAPKLIGINVETNKGAALVTFGLPR
ncbi:type II secretion system protein J [Labrenzia sp. PHM005]|uniref:PulJ/GspJ family protein n=1 Tax=Labrenzia sp. PHM005 TaxID=2590016 RepID=UPI00113FCAED|nr:prepilin-type N-terminal cleavage/methylation domain-containing protein [Labrenzia sp. PHM005]QDG74406.1 prepilin-type N-terminal cleavage/methylation domain-containing protein [Labrenzia sp. PHM005]